MKLGLPKKDYQYFEREVLLPLKSLGLKVYCFGSRARGDYRAFSDIDIMLENVTDELQRKTISEIQEKLSNSNFPLKIDLVDLNSFAGSYLENYQNEKIEL